MVFYHVSFSSVYDSTLLYPKTFITTVEFARSFFHCQHTVLIQHPLFNISPILLFRRPFLILISSF